MDDCINIKNRIVMKELQLIDRVVVEIRGEEGTSERLSLVYIANELRNVAEQIENGMKGDEWVEEDMRTHEHREVLFEHECTEFGFRMGDKSLIGMHYYGSEKKPKKYIVIVSVYDEENTQAYPLGGVFDTHEQAEQFISEHVNEVKANHWTKDCVDGEDFYEEKFSFGSFHAEDTSCGSSLDIDIHEVEEMV